MFKGGQKLRGKYFWIELIFLLLNCYFIYIVSDIEFNYYEKGNAWGFTDVLEYRFVYGTFNFILYGIYYWFFLKPYLFKRQFVYLLLSTIGFILLSEVCIKYEHLLVANLDFLSDQLQKRAMNDFNIKKLNYVLSYIIGRTLFTIFGFAFIIRSLQQDEEFKALKEQQLISELSYLKAQLQPHFFFNTLNNIYALAVKSSKHTATMVAKLSQMMRYIIYDSGESKVAVDREVEFIMNYVEIERIRRASEILIDFEVQGHVQNYKIEPLLLLPLVENAFKHGVEGEMTKGFVRIVLVISGKELTLQVENSVPSSSGLKHAGGMGLQNLNKRLNLIYRNRYQLVVENTEDTYRAILTLQLA